jgi:hypothetical protein
MPPRPAGFRRLWQSVWQGIRPRESSPGGFPSRPPRGTPAPGWLRERATGSRARPALAARPGRSPWPLALAAAARPGRSPWPLPLALAAATARADRKPARPTASAPRPTASTPTEAPRRPRLALARGQWQGGSRACRWPGRQADRARGRPGRTTSAAKIDRGAHQTDHERAARPTATAPTTTGVRPTATAPSPGARPMRQRRWAGMSALAHRPQAPAVCQQALGGSEARGAHHELRDAVRDLPSRR